MKKILFLLILFLFPLFAHAQDTECPFGEINEPAPGTCVKYIDSDGNDICDLSQIPLSVEFSKLAYTQETSSNYISEEELKQKNVSEMAKIYNVGENELIGALSEYLGIQVRSSDSLQVLHDENALCSGVAASIAVSLQSGDDLSSVETHDLISGQELKLKTVEEVAQIYFISSLDYAKALETYYKTDIRPTDSFQLLHDNAGLEPSKAKEIAVDLAENSPSVSANSILATPSAVASRKGYRFLSIFFVLTVLYANTLLLSNKKVITVLLHKRIWNTLLLISFLVSGLLGLSLIIRINYGWSPRLPFNILKLHVEAGVVMATITFFHIYEHRKFYTCMLRRPGNKENCKRG